MINLLIYNNIHCIIHDNVLIIDGNSKIKANNVTMNIITKDIRINSENMQSGGSPQKGQVDRNKVVGTPIEII